jgi:hypothetical protein
MFGVSDADVIGSYNVPGAQEHLDIPMHRDAAMGKVWEQEREATHAVDRITTWPDVYVDDGDVTVTIDPMTNEHWMRDDSTFWRHSVSRHRGALKDHAAVTHTMALLSPDGAPPETFTPAVSQIDQMDKFTPLCVASSTHGRRMGSNDGAGVLYAHRRGEYVESERFGKLPELSQRVYSGLLRDRFNQKALDYENQPLTYTRATDRAFDCGGNCR